MEVLKFILSSFKNFEISKNPLVKNKEWHTPLQILFETHRCSLNPIVYKQYFQLTYN